MGSKQDLIDATQFLAQHRIVPIVSDVLDGLEGLVARGGGGLAEGHLRDERPALGDVPRRGDLRVDERVVVLQGRAEALVGERGPDDVLEHALRRDACARQHTIYAREGERGGVRSSAGTRWGNCPRRAGTSPGGP